MKKIGSLGSKYLFAIMVIIPTILAALYYGLFAADQYISESRFIVKSQSRSQPQLSGLAGLLQTSGISAGQEQTNEVLSFIRSRDALSELSRSVDVKAMFSEPTADFLGKYPAFWREDRFENLFRFYEKMVESRVDSETNMAVLSVRAFKPDDAQKINRILLDRSEQLVNRLNIKAREKAISEARARVVEGEDRVRNARIAMAQYRNQEQLLDPVKQAGAVLEVSTRLVTEQTALQAQLDTMVSKTPRNPAIPALRRQIAALANQSISQSGRAVGTQTAISSKLAGFERVALEQEFATETLTAATAAYEQARVDAARQQFYLERVVEPNRPDISRVPNRIFKILTVFATAFCLYLIAWLLLVGILEHAPDD
jgi:capsular polysaccharide transport system permease protein